MGSKVAANFEKAVKQEQQQSEKGEPAKQDDQSELSLAIARAVTQVLESSDWRALSFPLQANAAKHSKAKNAVKRPMNPFMLYAQAARKKLSNLYPDLSYAKLSKTLGRIWKSLDQAEKQPFIDEAERLRQKHKVDHPDYKFQPKRREKKRTHSPSKDSFDSSKISTGDVLKVLSSSGNAKHHEAQNLWAHTIHNGIPSARVGVVQQNGESQQPNGILPAPPYSGSPRGSPNPLISKISSGGSTIYETSPSRVISTANESSFTPRYITPPPPPLQRATTASLFSPSTYRIPKSQPPSQPPFNEMHAFPAPSTTIQNYPSDLSLAIGNSFLKCSPQLARPPHLTHNEDQSTNLLTGVNQILRDMFGNDKNSVM